MRPEDQDAAFADDNPRDVFHPFIHMQRRACPVTRYRLQHRVRCDAGDVDDGVALQASRRGSDRHAWPGIGYWVLSDSGIYRIINVSQRQKAGDAVTTTTSTTTTT